MLKVGTVISSTALTPLTLPVGSSFLPGSCGLFLYLLILVWGLFCLIFFRLLLLVASRNVHR